MATNTGSLPTVPIKRKNTLFGSQPAPSIYKAKQGAPLTSVLRPLQYETPKKP